MKILNELFNTRLDYEFRGSFFIFFSDCCLYEISKRQFVTVIIIIIIFSFCFLPNPRRIVSPPSLNLSIFLSLSLFTHARVSCARTDDETITREFFNEKGLKKIYLRRAYKMSSFNYIR